MPTAGPERTHAHQRPSTHSLLVVCRYRAQHTRHAPHRPPTQPTQTLNPPPPPLCPCAIAQLVLKHTWMADWMEILFSALMTWCGVAR